MVKRIAITGPESTGKSTLATALAKKYNTVYRPEHARDYLNNLIKPYTGKDIEIIAREQLIMEKKMLPEANKYFIADTEMIVIKIWMEHKYQDVPDWVTSGISAQNYDLYLLCNIDIPWIEDPQREHPHLRDYFFKKYYHELSVNNFPFVVISGPEESRLNQAVKAIEKL